MTSPHPPSIIGVPRLAKPPLLILEPAHTGHHLSYVSLIAQAALAEGRLCILVTTPTTQMSRESDSYLLPLAGDKNFRIDPLLRAAIRLRDVPRLRKVIPPQADLVILEADRVVVPVALLALAGRRPAVALIMRTRAANTKERLAQLGKRAIVALLRALHCRIVRLAGAYGGSDASTTGLWSSLPVVNDPGPHFPKIPRATACDQLGLDQNRNWLVIAGTLTERKSIPQVLQWLSRTDHHLQPSLLLAGTPSEGVTRLLAEPHAQALQQQGRLAVITRFLEEAELHACFAAASAALILHENEGPSGALLYARHQSVPVITWGSRQVALDVKALGLGRVIPGRDHEDLDAALDWLITASAVPKAQVINETQSPTPASLFYSQLLGCDAAGPPIHAATHR